MRRLSGITAGTLCAVLAAVGCDALSIGLTSDPDYMLKGPEHDWLQAAGGGPPNPGCEADPTQNASTVTDECAVFVSATAEAGGEGTKARPYASLVEAVANAGNKRVLACTSGAFAESVTIGAKVEVIGGFDCEEEWVWSAEARSAIEGPAGAVALTMTEGASGAKVKSFAVRAASATEPGGSSIGVAVADVDAELAQVDVTAGDAMDGATGETSTQAPQAGASAPDTEETRPSKACDLPAAVRGGDPGVTTCEDGETRGGAGGLGGIPGMSDGNGQPGEDGVPLPDPNPEEYGIGGAGQTGGNCRQGEPGAPGATGDPGTPGSETTLTLAGIAGGDGGNGRTGTRGQGGGAGGGAKAGLFCKAGPNTIEGPGASGGGGGAGGCGGKGGGGGKAGGSSIGILSLGTKLVLTDVTVALGKAGKGGNGAGGLNGANGGAGAAGGSASETPPSIPGCKGGDGGRGGAGGPGAGGRGGHAVGIAYAVAPSAAVALKNFTEGVAGDGGSAGPGSAEPHPPVNGVSGACWNFGENEGCGQ
ncbi:hypothetical protein [Sorangium atrum]|uniref:PGRS family protein n=1 Tax=Sorangium atrum TaxID=2995308 RepID=A0ABT5C2T4_9BACT|nr:hypothetical protein [Sorangium aterium]MDC0680711.1 hypothetical protein [Sorangium aterium]